MSKPKEKEFAVLGLGHFGMRIVEVLAEYGVNVLACDNDPRRIQRAAAFATQTVQMNIEDEESLEQIGIGNFEVVIIATGEDFEAALTAATIAKEKGALHVMVKALTLRQKKILEGMGVDRVVLPEREMGEKIARNLLNVDIMDIFRDAEDFTISEIPPMAAWVGKTVAQSNIRTEHGSTILAIRRGYAMIAPVLPGEILQEDDLLIVWKERGR